MVCMIAGLQLVDIEFGCVFDQGVLSCERFDYLILTELWCMLTLLVVVGCDFRVRVHLLPELIVLLRSL